MGKGEDDVGLPGVVVDDAQGIEQNVGRSNERRVCRRLKRCVSFRCVFALLLGVAVFVSVLFWLPFFHYRNEKDLDLDSEFGGHAIVASFMVDKPASFLEDNISQLQDDIFGEISFPTTKVEVLKLESSYGSNATKVVFAVDADPMSQSLIRGSFLSLLIRQSPFRLTESLFGNPYSFEVLKFFGGIIVSPQQSAFLMQTVQIMFNFTLNFSIEQLQSNFDELRRQLISGLHLASYENLYVSLGNWRGSTVAPPTSVQCKVLLAVGINPSMSRIKQLTQRITSSPAENLGLNNTVFGKVKQVSLSSTLPHSPGGTGSPSPAPLPQSQHHHHHHHHHHYHQPDVSHSPAHAPQHANSGALAGKGSPLSAPVSAPAPAQHKTMPPGCRFGYKNRHPRDWSRHAPIPPPMLAPYSSPSPKQSIYPPQTTVPEVPATSPIPHVVYAHVRPPSESVFIAEPPDLTNSIAPSPSSSSASIMFSNLWALPMFLLLMLLVQRAH